MRAILSPEVRPVIYLICGRRPHLKVGARPTFCRQKGENMTMSTAYEIEARRAGAEG